MKFTAICALLAGVAGLWSCSPADGETPGTPTGAEAISVTATGATLIWDAVAGADRYEIRLDEPEVTRESAAENITRATESEGGLINSPEDSYVLTDLTPSTSYTWSVRAVSGNAIGDWATGEPFTTKAAGTDPDDDEEVMSVKVNFGGGDEVWDAVYAEWVDYRGTEYDDIDIYAEAVEFGYPNLMGCILPSGTTTFPDAWDIDEYTYFEYYSENWESVGEELFDGEYYYGDWFVDGGEVTITSITATTLSYTADLVMFDYYDYEVNLNDYPATTTLVITAANVPMVEAEATNAAVRAAMASPDRTFSFKNDRAKIAGSRKRR
ncbi:MAG: fibronectin type III domain-containing protein [Alistipes sp.]|nr:fibronectin type III domain-containing protein [Alistipes sp.]